MADLDSYVSDLKSMAHLLLSICESMEDIESINMHVDVIEGIPYVNFAAFGKNHGEPTLSWHDLPNGPDGKGKA